MNISCVILVRYLVSAQSEPHEIPRSRQGALVQSLHSTDHVLVVFDVNPWDRKKCEARIQRLDGG